MKKFYLLFLLMLSLQASADPVLINGIYYNLNAENQTAEVKQHDYNSGSYSSEVVIPMFVSYEGIDYIVTSIGVNAFTSRRGLTSITIPHSVTSIGTYAFNGCSGLTSITIPNSVTSIDDGAFSVCSSLTSITFPNNLTSLGARAFDGTAWYNNQPDGLVYAGSCVYKYKGEMPENTTISLKEGTTGIAEEAFSGCNNLTSITIPNSVISIGYLAFSGCSSLASVTIPISVISVGINAFDGTAWYDNQPDGLVYAGSCAYRYKGEMPANTIISIKDGTTEIVDQTFKGCSGLTSVTIPNSVTSIGISAFYGCSGLTSITIPNSVTSIGNLAFYNCSSLTSLIIGNRVTSIGRQVFYGCNVLSSIEVESGNIKYDSRDNCNAIIETSSNTLIAGSTNTIIPNSVTSIGYGAFEGRSGLTSITFPNSVTEIQYEAFMDCTGLTSIELPNSIKRIDGRAFANCSISTVTIPSSVTDIAKTNGESPFINCNNLTSIIVESGNTVYDSRNNCNAIIETATNELIAGCKTTIIPNSVTSIGYNSICGFKDLTSIAIPSSVTSIANGAFQGCGLTSVTIPNSVVSIGRFAFGNCHDLESVTSLALTPPEMKDDSFYNYNIPLYVPKGTRDAYLAASPWNKFKEIIELDNTDEDEITIKDIGKTTWCSEYDLDFTNVAGIKAYIAIGYDDIDKTIWLARVMKVPAGTGLLVKGDAGTYKIPHANVRSTYVNYLKGNLGDAIKIEETDGDKTNYYLSGKDGTFVSVNGSANIGKNKAYLQLPTSVFGGTRSIGISYDDEDGTTSIKNLTPAHSEGGGAWYTLQGQRVAKPGKGLYIHNGKKVVIK